MEEMCMKTPILDRLNLIRNKERISFHMPGHKGKNTLINWGDYIPYLDTTELPGLDNLHNAIGIIDESEKLAAKAFGAKQTMYSINGTTGSMYIALATVTNPGDKILVQRQSHKSIYNGAILNRLNIEYIYTNYNEKHHLYTGLDPRDIELKLKEDPSIKVVVITNPNYFGICSDIEKIAEIVHRYNRILVVDEAHGSHFAFSDRLPMTALQAGADMCVQSTHKTLPSFTQTSVIHVGSDRVDIDKLKSMSSLFQTTSPSYLFMLSIEIARAYMEGEGKQKLDENIDIIDKMIKDLNNMDRVYVFTRDEDDKTIKDKDITKILFSIEGIRGTDLKKILREEYGIYVEMADYYYALALSSVMNDKEEFDSLKRAIEDIALNKPEEDIKPFNFNLPKPEIHQPIYEAYYSPKEVIDLKESIGRVCSSLIIPYPPGIPLICPGEVITEDLIEYIEFATYAGIEILGLMGYNKEKIQVVK